MKKKKIFIFVLLFEILVVNGLKAPVLSEFQLILRLLPPRLASLLRTYILELELFSLLYYNALNFWSCSFALLTEPCNCSPDNCLFDWLPELGFMDNWN